MRGGLFSVYLLAILTVFGTETTAAKNVEYVTSIDKFYDTCNSKDSYTVVKYFTTWCSHCKRLAPVFEDLSQVYEKEDMEGLPPINFLNVDCDIFGSTICAGMPGFPIIQFVKPRLSPLEITAHDSGKMSLFDRIWNIISKRFRDPKWHLDEDRIVEFRGRRDLETLKNFVELLREKDQLEILINKIIDNEYRCEDSKFCPIGKTYVKETLSRTNGSEDISIERIKLENIIKNNTGKEGTDSDALEIVNFKLQMLNQYEDKIIEEQKKENKEFKEFKDLVHDEL